MMDHCRMHLCFVLDKSFECLLKAMVSAQKHLLILLLYLNSPLCFYMKVKDLLKLLSEPKLYQQSRQLI